MFYYGLATNNINNLAHQALAEVKAMRWIFPALPFHHPWQNSPSTEGNGWLHSCSKTSETDHCTEIGISFVDKVPQRLWQNSLTDWSYHMRLLRLVVLMIARLFNTACLMLDSSGRPGIRKSGIIYEEKLVYIGLSFIGDHVLTNGLHINSTALVMSLTLKGINNFSLIYRLLLRSQRLTFHMGTYHR